MYVFGGFINGREKANDLVCYDAENETIEVMDAGSPRNEQIRFPSSLSTEQSNTSLASFKVMRKKKVVSAAADNSHDSDGAYAGESAKQKWPERRSGARMVMHRKLQCLFLIGG